MSTGSANRQLWMQAFARGSTGGTAPEWLSTRLMFRHIMRSSDEKLWQIVNLGFWNFYQTLALLQLAARGQNVRSQLPRIVKMLEQRELCVCEVREVLNLSTSTVSRHLTILRDAGLILDRKDGKWVNFRLNADLDDGMVRPLLSVLKKGLADEKQILQDREKVKRVDRNKLCGL